MTLRFTLAPVLTPELRAGIAELWTEVANTGGAVGFISPVHLSAVRRMADKHFEALVEGADRPPAEGGDRLLVAHEEQTGRLAAVVFFEDMNYHAMDHWRLLKRVMVHPDFQGRGYGSDLLAEVERVARGWGLEGLRLTLRAGLGLEAFYARSGYKEVGRVPAAIRVADGDDRDDVTMWLDLR